MTRFVRPLATRLAALAPVLGLLLASGSLVGTSAHATPQSEQAVGEYARVQVGNARILNLADTKGVAVASPEQGSIVQIFDRTVSGWVLVEVPGGYPVWVFGKYLQATGTDTVFEVTRNAVNIRPGPSSDVTNFPLPQRLHAGDRVQVIETLDPGKPLEETWARIWSPPGVRAWMQSSAVAPLAAGDDAAALWSAALAANADRVAPVAAKSSPGASTVPASSTKTKSAEDQAGSQLAAAQALLEAERAKERPDFGSVRSEFEAVVALAPSAATAVEARQSLSLLDALEKAQGVKVELELAREQRIADAIAGQKRVQEAAKRKDPLGAVFVSRGVLFRRMDTKGESTFLMRFGGETVAEIICPSGRYDLQQFAGCEIGVQGSELESSQSRPIPVLQVSRVEIIKRR